RIAGEITLLPGASVYFKGGAVAYSNEAKVTMLGVERALIERRGAVSEEVAVAMAEGIRRLLGTDYAVATTGVAGPGGGSPGKPVGTVWIAVATPAGTVARVFHFSFARERNMGRATMRALEMLLDALPVEARVGAAVGEVDYKSDCHPDD
ncbi:MAG: CinA family protein, partial [Odoribacteraceae bacterium]|nr:CinA family protein [Odoribacteraceae bacterium]